MHPQCAEKLPEQQAHLRVLSQYYKQDSHLHQPASLVSILMRMQRIFHKGFVSYISVHQPHYFFQKKECEADYEEGILPEHN
jgi:hypothetical protein